MDPQFLSVHHTNDELNSHSLKDVSEGVIPRGVAAVEPHDDSPDSVQRNRTESISESQDVAVESAFHLCSPLQSLQLSASPTPTASSSTSPFTSPSLDDESGDQTSISPESITSPDFDMNDASAPDQVQFSAPQPYPTNNLVSAQTDASIRLPAGYFPCPLCPRTFKDAAKARYDTSKSPTYHHS